MTAVAEGWVRAAALAALPESGCSVVAIGGQAIALFRHEGGIYAVDNRCPHMGFPLSRGTVADGLLTCHWHHARFDLVSGGTLDPFADDVRSYPVRVEGDAVYVDVSGRGAAVAYWKRRLNEGLEQQLSLVIAKAVLALLAAGVTPAEIVAIGGAYGIRYRDRGWNTGMTILTALANVLPHLDAEDRALALVHGLTRVAEDCAGRPPRFGVDPLPQAEVAPERLKAWFRRAVDVRDDEGGERVLHTALEAGASAEVVLDLLYAAATDHYYVDAGHEIDFITKAGEYVGHAGPEQAAPAYGSLVRGLCAAARSEEQYAWRYPLNLVAIVEPAAERLRALWPSGGGDDVRDLEMLAELLLGEDPQATADTLLAELAGGASAAALGRAVAYAAALRLARFPTSNEFGDWDTVHNTWSSCHALCRALERAPSPELGRGLLHAAMRLYLDRFLNVPPARLPDETPARPPRSADELLDDLNRLFDRQQQVDQAASVVSDYLNAGFDDARLLATIGRLTLREDADFHNYQTLEAGMRLYRSLRDTNPRAARRTLVGVIRYLAAHAPTARALNQTWRIAVRLHRGEQVFAEEG